MTLDLAILIASCDGYAQYVDVCGIGGQTQPASAEEGGRGLTGEGGGFACPLPPGAAACNYNSANVTCG